METLTIKPVDATASETNSYSPINVSRVEYEYENASGNYIMKESNGRNRNGWKQNSVGDKVSVALTAFKKAKGSRLHKIIFYGEDGSAIDFEKLGIGVEHKAEDNWVYLNYYGKKYYYDMLKTIDITWIRYYLDDLLKNGCINSNGKSAYNYIVKEDNSAREIMEYWQNRKNALTETENAFLALKNNIDTMSCEKVFGVMSDYDEFHPSNISVPEYNIWKAIINKEGMFELLVSNNCITVEIDMTPAYMEKKPILFVQTNFYGFLKDSEFEMELDSLNITPDFIKSFAIQSMVEKMDEKLYEQGLIEKEA